MSASRYLLAVPALALLALPALAGDLLLGTNGKMQGNRNAQNPPKSTDYADSNWTVIDERLDEITYRIENVPQPQRVKSASIAKIFYDPQTTPPEYFEAMQAEMDGDYAGARDLWGALSDRGKQPWTKARGAFGAAVSHYFEGNFPVAAQELGKFERQFSNSRYVPESIRYRANALLGAGKVAEARSAFESMKKLAGLSDDEKLGADFWLAWIDEQVAAAKNDKAGLKKALDAYKSLKVKLGSKSSDTAKMLKDKCAVGVASCQIGLGDWKTPKDALTKMAAKSKDPLALAGIHTMLGNCLMLQNSSAHDKAVYREALDHFLRVVCLYGPTQGAESYYAESLYKSGSLFYELRPTETDEASLEKKKRWGQYARREFSECIRLFPASGWARKSREDMR